MPRINLLPWRDEQRKRRQKETIVAIIVAAVVGGFVIAATWVTFDAKIKHQIRRNELLQQEIVKLDKQIAEIDELESIKERLIARMEIIQELQSSRPGIVHLFEELVRTVPEGIVLSSVSQEGERLEINGIAQSSTRVSAYMRNIDASPWLSDPRLEIIETDTTGRIRESKFTVVARYVSEQAADEDEGTDGDAT